MFKVIWLLQGWTHSTNLPDIIHRTYQKFLMANLLMGEVSPIWFRWDVILFGSLFILFISLGSYGLGINLRDKRKKELEKLVKERTEELEKANTELQHRNSELDRFVYSASHDLSSPLKSILGLINVAKLEDPDPRQLQYLDMMQKSVDKLELFIEEVIQYSRNARMPIRQATFEFKKFIKDILLDYKYVSNYDKIQFNIEIQGDVEIATDEMRLKIIINNLISNAIKFHRFDEPVVPRVDISMTSDDSNYFISVEDNGRGIQSEFVEKIFEMFFRGTEKTQGSGLGLYILKETVTRLDGKIDVKSKIGQGTIFNVTIPRVTI